MTHIEQLIQDLCPQGVEFKKLGEVTYWDKRFNEVERSMQPQIRKYHYYLASELEALESPTGTIKILYTSNKIAYAEEETVAENVVDAEVVAIPWGGNANIKYFKGKFVTADNRIAVVRDTSILSTKFVYYWLMKNQTEIDSYYRGAGIKHPSMLKVLSLEIPIPPIEIQKIIVECLDKFSALAAELQAELQAELHLRRKQYEYYRTHLLTPHTEGTSTDKSDDCNWDSKPLKELIVSLKTGLNPRTNFKLNTPESNIPYITGKDIYDNVINVTSATDMIDEKARDLINKRACLEGNILLFASTGTGTVGRMAYVPEYNNDWAMSETLYAIKTKDVLLPRFLMHCLYSPVCRSQFENKISRGSVPHLKVVDLLNVNIPLPPIEEQKRLTELLDKFDKLTTSLEEGIPAEQIRQQKRYEYYRDLLLTFPRKEV